MSENSLKFIFVGIVVFFALIGRGGGANQSAAVAEKLPPKQNTIAHLAEVKSIVSEKQLDFFEVPRAEKIIPKRNSVISDPILSVRAAFVKDLDTDTELFSFNKNLKWPLASLTKLMTAIVTIENVGLDKKATVTETAVAAEGISGNFSANEEYKIGEILRAMLLVSSNDAAMVISEFYGGDNLIRQMQSDAYSLGMDQTNFADPTGISSLNQGTISDLEKLVRYILEKHRDIFQTTKMPSALIHEEISGAERELKNINAYAYANPRSDFLGGKTGFTDEAGGNLISLFDYNGHTILLIVFGTDDRFGQTDILYNWIKKAYTFN